MILNYDSMTDFVDSMDNVNHASPSEWNGEESVKTAKQGTLQGRSEGMDAAEAMIDKIEHENITSYQSQWSDNVAGAFPIVPAAIIGSPFSMRVKNDFASSQAPIRIYASCCTSAGVDAPKLAKRGAAILALVLKLTETRTVELYIVAELEGSSKNGLSAIPCVRIDTSPLDIKAATYALTSPAFLRQLCFKAAAPHGYSGRWAYNSNPQNVEFQEKAKSELGCLENDLYIRGGFLGDKNINNPVEWVSDMLQEVRERGES